MVNGKIKIVSYTLCLLCALLLISCQDEPAVPDQLVVEGWIEQGQHPKVLLHRSYLTANHEKDDETPLEDMIGNQLIPFGRVAISDGSNEVVLTGRINTGYMPPTLYTTSEMIGEEGKTYTITVDYKEMHATAVTRIPQAVIPDSIVITTYDTIASLQLYVSDLPQEETNYLVCHYLLRGEQQYKLCPLSPIAVTPPTPSVRISLTPSGIVGALPFGNFSTRDTLVHIRLSRIDESEYLIYQSLAAQSIEQGIYYVPIYKNIESNIHGGLGYWAGLGSYTTAVPLVRDSVIIP